MKNFGSLIRDSGIARFITAMLVSILLTCATFLPFLIQGALGTPVPLSRPESLPQPESQPQPQPGPQAYSPVPYFYPEPEPCYGNCSWIHDPTIYYEDGVYWRFSTSRNIPVATAPSLEGPWEFKGHLLHRGTNIDLFDGQDTWAPFVTKIDDTYYCYYSVSKINQQHSEIGVATSQFLSPGKWQDQGSIGLPQNKAYNLIDPYVYQENPSSQVYFTFGSYWTGIQQIALNSHEELTAWSGSEDRIKNIIRNDTVSHAVVEGALMHKQDDFYYVFYSVGKCCQKETELAPPGDEYHVAVCRADSPTGPYFDREGKSCLTENGGTTILGSHGDVYAPGGQGIMLHPENGRTVMYYHYVRRSVGYEEQDFLFGFNYLDWQDGWPVVV